MSKEKLWMQRCLVIFFVLGLISCSDSVEPIKVKGHEKQPFENNATDAVGVAEGDNQVSPFGKPAY